MLCKQSQRKLTVQSTVIWAFCGVSELIMESYGFQDRGVPLGRIKCSSCARIQHRPTHGHRKDASSNSTALPAFLKSAVWLHLIGPQVDVDQAPSSEPVTFNFFGGNYERFENFRLTLN